MITALTWLMTKINRQISIQHAEEIGQMHLKTETVNIYKSKFLYKKHNIDLFNFLFSIQFHIYSGSSKNVTDDEYVPSFKMSRFLGNTYRYLF